MLEQAMWVRGQYFFSLTALSLFLLGSALTHYRKVTYALFTLVMVWGYSPWIVGMYHVITTPKNEFQLEALQTISTHPDRKAVLEASVLINSLCNEKDSVVITQYDPGLDRVLKCPDLFGKDAYIFTRLPSYYLKPGETPYAPEGEVTNRSVLEKIINEAQPRFFIFENFNRPFSRVCQLPHWRSQTFGAGGASRTLCWQEIKTPYHIDFQ
jgi:hypothetical protein